MRKNNETPCRVWELNRSELFTYEGHVYMFLEVEEDENGGVKNCLVRDILTYTGSEWRLNEKFPQQSFNPFTLVSTTKIS